MSHMVRPHETLIFNLFSLSRSTPSLTLQHPSTTRFSIPPASSVPCTPNQHTIRRIFIDGGQDQDGEDDDDRALAIQLLRDQNAQLAADVHTLEQEAALAASRYELELERNIRKAQDLKT